MTGRAVVTTRLSRATMNSASEVMANVQRALDRVRVIRWTPFGEGRELVVTKFTGRKKGGGRDRQVAPPDRRPRPLCAEQTAERPGLRLAVDLERSGDVEEHPLGEEAVDLLVRCAAVALHRRIQRRELLTDDLADVLVATGRVGLELDAQQVAIGQQSACRPRPIRSRTEQAWSSSGGRVGRPRGRRVASARSRGERRPGTARASSRTAGRDTAARRRRRARSIRSRCRHSRPPRTRGGRPTMMASRRSSAV